LEGNMTIAQQLSLDRKMHEAIVIFKRLLRGALHGNLVEIKLFGSRAKGAARADSDFDFLILVKRVTPAVKDQVIDISTRILLDYSLDFTTIIHSEKEYREARKLPTVFSQLVERHSIII